MHGNFFVRWTAILAAGSGILYGRSQSLSLDEGM